MTSVSIGEFEYSHSSSSLSSSLHVSAETPERRRGPTHGEPASYFFSEGGISPGSHTAVYDRAVPAQPHHNGVEADNVFEWSPSSSISASTSPRARQLGAESMGSPEKTAYSLDGGLSSPSRSRSSSQLRPHHAHSAASSATQLTLPTLHPVRDGTASTSPAAPATSVEPRRLSTTRSFDRDDGPHCDKKAGDEEKEEDAAAQRSPLPTAVETPVRQALADRFDGDVPVRVVVSPPSSSSSSPIPTHAASRRQPRADAEPRALGREEAAVQGSTSGQAHTGETRPSATSRSHRLTSPSHAATHSPHKRALPPPPRAWRGEKSASRSLSASQPRRSPSTQTNGQLHFNFLDDDDDASAERPPSLSPPPTLRQDEMARLATTQEPTPEDTREAHHNEEEEGLGVVLELQDRLSAPREPSSGPAGRVHATQPHSIDADGGADSDAGTEDADGVVRSPEPSALRQQPHQPSVPRKSSLPSRDRSAPTKSVTVSTSMADAPGPWCEDAPVSATTWQPAHTISSHPAQFSSAPSRSASRSPSASAVAVSPLRGTTSPPFQSRLDANSRRRLCLHTVSADRGRTPSALRHSRRSSLDASLAGHGVSDADGENTAQLLSCDDADGSGRKPCTRETSLNSSVVCAAEPLLFTALRGDDDVARAATHTTSASVPQPGQIGVTSILTSPRYGTISGSTLRAVPFKSASTTSGVPPAGRESRESGNPLPYQSTDTASAGASVSLLRRSSLVQRPTTFRSSAIRARGETASSHGGNRTWQGASCVSAMPSRMTESGAAVAASRATRTDPSDTFHVQFIPYVSTRISPARAQTATAQHTVAGSPSLRTGATVNDSATSPIARTQAVPSSLWSSYAEGAGLTSEAMHSPRPRNPAQRSSVAPPFRGTPEQKYAAPPPLQPPHTGRSPQLLSAEAHYVLGSGHGVTAHTDPASTSDACDRLLDAVEETRAITRLLAQKTLAHAEACDREKVRLLESHFWRTLQTEWCYCLTVERLLQDRAEAATAAASTRQRTCEWSPVSALALPAHRSPSRGTMFSAFAEGSHATTPNETYLAKTGLTNMESIMKEQSALAEELQYLSSALAELTAQHAC